MRRHRAVFLASLLAAAGAAFARTDEPIRSERLANGARLVMQQRPGCGTFGLTLTALGGTAEDTPDQIGLSEILARMVLRGTESRTADQQAIEMEGAGVTLDSAADVLGISVRASGPGGALGPALDVTLDAASHPLLERSDLVKEIGLARQHLRGTLDIPSTARERAMRTLLFGDHPLGRVAEPKTYLTSLDVDQVGRAHADRFTGSRLILVLVGDFEAGLARARAVPLLERLPAGEAAPAALPRPEALAAPRRVHVRRRTAQPELVVAMPTSGIDEADEPALDLLLHIAAGFSERLSTEIRETRGWAYWLGALDWRYPGAGAFGIVTAVPRGHLEETSSIIRRELWRLAAEAPSQEEVERARRFLLTSKARSWQRSEERALAFAAGLARGRPPRTFEEMEAGYAEVTPEAIRALARRLMESSELATLTVY